MKHQSVDALTNAAIAFAFDHGPIATAREGYTPAREEVGKRLFKALKDQGLVAVVDEEASE